MYRLKTFSATADKLSRIPVSTTASVNPALASLIQTLSNVGSPVLSCPQAMSALEKASPSDIVQISAAATELETANAMFGSAGLSATNLFSPSAASALSTLYQPAAATDSTDTTDPLTGLEQALAAASDTATGDQTATNSTASTTSLADAVAKYQKSLQSQEMQMLLGTGSNAYSTTDSTYFG